MGFFCSVNFSQSIYSSKRIETGIIRKPFGVQYGIKKDFFSIYVFFREFSKFEVL